MSWGSALTGSVIGSAGLIAGGAQGLCTAHQAAEQRAQAQIVEVGCWMSWNATPSGSLKFRTRQEPPSSRTNPELERQLLLHASTDSAAQGFFQQYGKRPDEVKNLRHEPANIRIVNR